MQKREMEGDFESALAEFEEFIPSTKVDLVEVESFDQESVEGSGGNSITATSKPSLPFEPSFVVTLHPEAGYRDDATYPKTSAAPRIHTDHTLIPQLFSEDVESNDVLPEEEVMSESIQPEVERKEEEDNSIFLPILPTDPPNPEEPQIKSSGGLFSWIIETMAANDKVEVTYDPDDSTTVTEPPVGEVQSFDQTSSSRPCKSYLL